MKVIYENGGKGWEFFKKGAIYLIKNMNTKLIVANIETNYEPILAKQESHKLKFKMDIERYKMILKNIN